MSVQVIPNTFSLQDTIMACKYLKINGVQHYKGFLLITHCQGLSHF